MRKLVDDAGLGERIEVDSAGTGSWHVGEPPDARATAALRAIVGSRSKASPARWGRATSRSST